MQLKFIQGEIDNLNWPMPLKEIELIMKYKAKMISLMISTKHINKLPQFSAMYCLR